MTSDMSLGVAWNRSGSSGRMGGAARNRLGGSRPDAHMRQWFSRRKVGDEGNFNFKKFFDFNIKW